VPVNDDAPRGDLRAFLAIGEPPERLVPDRPATAAGEIEIRGVRVVR
jgi:hypothetical protein